MSSPAGWRPLSGPAAPEGRAQSQFVLSPFARLARTHAVSAAADAMVATALAGTIFFEGATSEARGKVLAYLLLTMAPFAVAAPLIGPLLDRVRGGRRWMIAITIGARGLLCFLMAGDVDGLLLYPEAFLVLVMQKSYAVSRASLVPSTVRTAEELVEANSKLQLISGLMGFVGALPAALLFKVGGASWSLLLAFLAFGLGTVLALRIPSDIVADAPDDDHAKAELRGVGVVLAASGMGLMRGIVGYLTVFVAFFFRADDQEAWQFVVVAAVSLAGGLVGAALAPRLRVLAQGEERLLTAVLGTVVLAAGAALAINGYLGMSILGGVVGAGSVVAKQAFDAIVQRDAPDANRGRSFARFETRFQIIWVVGAMLGLIQLPLSAGMMAVLVVALFAAFSYGVGSLAWKHRAGTARTPMTERAVMIDERMTEVQVAARRNLRRSAHALRQRMGRRGPGPDDQAGPVGPAGPA